MKISQTFPSKFAKAADLNGRPVTLTIAKLIMEEMGFGAEAERKPVLYFQRATKGLVLNATNARTIAALYGDESDGWTGKRVTLYPTRVRAFGSMHDTIRIKEDMPPTHAAAQVEEAAEIDDVEDFTDADDEGHNASQPTQTAQDATLVNAVPNSTHDELVYAAQAARAKKAVRDHALASAPDDTHDELVYAADGPDPLWDAPAPRSATQAELDALDAHFAAKVWEAPVPPRATQAKLNELDAVGIAYYTKDYWLGKLPELVLGVTTGATNNPRELTPDECARLIRGIESHQIDAVQIAGAEERAAVVAWNRRAPARQQP